MINETNGSNKPLGVVLHEIKDDLKDFLQTRYDMLAGEISEKIGVWKTSLPMLLIAGVLAVTAFLAITFAIIAALRPLFDNAYGWAIAALIVAVLYLAVAGIIAWLAYREIQYAGVAPKRTLQVLKQDQVWLQNEARQQS
jgi:uncharacterized membrane protein YqjE